jgi:hypothetical protein
MRLCLPLPGSLTIFFRGDPEVYLDDGKKCAKLKAIVFKAVLVGGKGLEPLTSCL